MLTYCCLGLFTIKGVCWLHQVTTVELFCFCFCLFYMHYIFIFLQVVQLDPVIEDDIELQKYSKVTWKQQSQFMIHSFIHSAL